MTGLLRALLVDAKPKGITNENLLPWLTTLWTLIWPPIMVTSRWAMASPKPLPPWVRVVEEST